MSSCFFKSLAGLLLSGSPSLSMQNTDKIDVANAGRRVWLVRVPDYLAERLAQIEADQEHDATLDEDTDEEPIDKHNAEIGLVRVVKSSEGGPNRVLFSLTPDGPCGGLPLDYELNLSRCKQTMHVFSTEQEKDSERAISVLGRVEQECNLRPIIDDTYRAIMRERDQVANKPKRTIRLLDVESEARTGFIPHIRESDLIGNRRKRLESDIKRERLPRDEVTDMLFRAFERKPHWTFHDLIEHTRQPSLYLKEILADISIYNTRGPNKNLYELKVEYRNGFMNNAPE